MGCDPVSSEATAVDLTPRKRTQKINPQKIKKSATNSRPRTECPRQKEPKSTVSIFV